MFAFHLCLVDSLLLPGRIEHSLSRGPSVSPRRVAWNLANGTITVYLPNRIETGDRISGSVFASSSGDWATQHQSLEYLDSLYLRIGDQRIELPQAMFTLKATGPELQMDIEDASGSILCSSGIKITDQGPERTWSSTRVIQAGMPIAVQGSFSGDRSLTQASINGHSIGILAEGPTEVYITSPMKKLGAIDVRVQDPEQVVEHSVCVVTLTYLAPGKSTESGKETSIGVDVEGLADADPTIFPVTVEMSIDDPRVAHFEGPQAECGTLCLYPSDLVQGHVLKSLPIRAGGQGLYSITARLY
jgi:hypothetical protein